jgi:hypothetical protein
MRMRPRLLEICTATAIVMSAACTQDAVETTPMAAPPVAETAAGVDLAAEFIALSASEDVSAEDWFSLAARARVADDLDTAGKALANASSDLPPVRIRLEQARLAVASGEIAVALDLLEALSNGGYSAVRAISDDAAFSPLRGEPRFEALVHDMSVRAFPCARDEAFRAFDFWLGSWDVHQPNGQFAGTNLIRSEESGCVLTEHWTGASGGTGSSINYLDKASGEWVQVWNSEGGAQISIRGGMTDEGMRLIGTIHYVGNGTTAPFRGLWTPLDDGRVRQFFEQSNDGGDTWAPWFEGYYTRSSESDSGTAND